MILSTGFPLRCALAALVLLCASALAVAQVSDKVVRVGAGAPAPGKPLVITAELSSTVSVERIEVAYRQFGERDYRRSEMALAGNTGTATIPAAELVPPFLEYYLILTLRTSAVPETYPLENAPEHPLRVDLQGAETTTPPITILSPDRDERLNPEDVLISFSLSPRDTGIDDRATRVFLDGVDVSQYVVATDRLYVLRPENLSGRLDGGDHGIRIQLFDRNGTVVTDYRWNFKVTRAGQPFSAGPASEWVHNVGLQLETRQENLSNDNTPYNRGTLTASGAYQQFRFNGKIYVTNEETDRRQPQNRFFLGVESPWAKVGFGDSYPVFPDLIMTGKRVRGVAGSLTLGWFNLDVSKGDIARKIESDTIKTFPSDSLASVQQRDSTAHFGLYDASSNPQRWAEFASGTFSRDVTVIRPSFGREDSRIGFSLLKSSDDPGSIRYGVRPQENLVAGSDLVLRLDRRNIELTGQAAISATNRDISRGTFSDAQIDSIYQDPTYSEDYRNRVRRTRDEISRFITVNENLVPLSAKDLTTLAYEGAIGLNYFDNTFRLGYVRRGQSYESFGQPFLRTDVRGYNLSDRLRLMEQKLFLSGGFEFLKDNTANTKASTTASTTANVGVSYYPRSEYPDVTVAYLLASNVNDRDLSDTVYAIDDRTDRILVQLAKEFTFGVRHNAVLSVSTSTRDDHTVKNLDTRNTTVSLSNSSTYSIPLQTTFSLVVNSSKFVTGFSPSPLETTLSYTTLSASAQYRMAEDRLRLSGSLSPTFGDIQRVLVDASAQYYFMRNLSAQTQLFLYFNNKLFGTPNPTTDTIWSLILRLDV